jgi:hypothetical protein
LQALPAESPRILLAAGKLVGEGFDHPPLDTLVLTMPISWKGTLQQYAHRQHAGKDDVRIVDFVDCVIRRCGACGTSGDWAVARWGIGLRQNSWSSTEHSDVGAERCRCHVLTP